MSGRAPGKVAAIRVVLRRRGAPMPLSELLPLMESRLKQVVGRSELYTLLSVMMAAGEIASQGRGRDRVYGLTPCKAAR